MATLDELAGTSSVSLDELAEEEPSIPERILSAGGRSIENLPGAIGSTISAVGRGVRGLANILVPSPQSPSFSELGELLKGAGSGVTAGIYQPEEAPTETGKDVQALGTLAGGVLPFSKLLQGARALGLSTRLAVPTVAGVMGAVPGAVHGGLEGAVEGGVTGAGLGTVGELASGAGRMAAKRIARPYERSVIAPQEQYIIDVNAAFAKQQAEALALEARRTAQNLEHRLQVAQQQDSIATQAQTYESRQAAIALRDSALADARQLRSQLPGQLEVQGRPTLTVAEGYETFNLAKQTPETLPLIELGNASKTIHELGGGLAEASKGLPKAAGPSGMVEKVAVGLEEALGEPGKTGERPIHPRATAYFGKAPVKPELLKTLSDIMYKEDALSNLATQIGVGTDGLKELAGGNLRLDQAELLMQRLGEASKNSRLASKLFWSIRDDVAASTDPLAQSLLKGRANFAQHVAMNDLAFMAAPTWKQGISIINVDRLRTVFEGKTRTDRQIIKSFPEGTLKAMVNTIEKVYQAERQARAAQQAIPRGRGKIIIPSIKGKFEPIPRPDPFVPPPEPDPTQFIPREPSTQLGQAIQQAPVISAITLSGLAKLAGVPLPYSGAIGVMALGSKVLPEVMFKFSLMASRTKPGRAFLENLFRGEAPNPQNTAKLMALGSFVASQAQEEADAP